MSGRYPPGPSGARRSRPPRLAVTGPAGTLSACVTTRVRLRALEEALEAYTLGPARRVLLLPPDFTRRHSGAGELTTLLFDRLAGRGHRQRLLRGQVGRVAEVGIGPAAKYRDGLALRRTGAECDRLGLEGRQEGIDLCG